jgi:ATP-dependent helicase/nuclease subunit B
LNICSFRDELCLSYATDDEESGESEILRYIKRIFSDTQDDEDLFLYEVSEPMPALKVLLRLFDDYREGVCDTREKYAALYAALMKREDVRERCERLAAGVQVPERIGTGERLFFSEEGISPTLLEQYHACPYKNFVEKGLKLEEREETAVMATDTGTFVHKVLEEVAKKCETWQTEEECLAFAEERAKELLKQPVYAALADTSAGEYAGQRLCRTSAKVALEVYRQIRDSNFKVKYTEYICKIEGERLNGKIDRVDEWKDYVRIIDYKTGQTDNTVAHYYAGTKIQLPLYMSAMIQGKRPAGMYYFPASEKFVSEGEEPFRLVGFMNSSPEVIHNSDTTLQAGDSRTSRYIDANYADNSRKKSLMSEADFRRFIEYALLISRVSEGDLKAGFISPTPYGDACAFCAVAGMCGAFGKVIPRKICGEVKCSEIVEIVKNENGKTETNAEEEEK